jgi:hypothetical protein
VEKKPIRLVAGVESIHFTCKKDDVQPADLVKQVKSEVSIGLKINDFVLEKFETYKYHFKYQSFKLQ